SVDPIAIVVTLMALGAAVAKDGTAVQPLTLGLFSAVILFLLLQLTGGPLIAEWAGYADWKSNALRYSGHLDLEVKKLSDGRLVNTAKENTTTTDGLILGAGMLASGFSWVAVPVTFAILALRQWNRSIQK
nr:non-structural protein NS2b [Apoi virus]